MKRLIIIALLAYAGWTYYQRSHPAPVLPATQSTAAAMPQVVPSASPFHCDGRQYCSQMSSRAEAEFFLQNCPDTKMDGDHDGVPCENDSRF